MRVILIILAALIVTSVKLVHGQISTPCTTALMSTFTPCANIITGSTNNGFAPPSTCCDSLRSLMNTNMDCACLVISANAPLFQLPINQVLALFLSRACNINGIALQCKGENHQKQFILLHLTTILVWTNFNFPTFPNIPI